MRAPHGSSLPSTCKYHRMLRRIWLLVVDPSFLASVGDFFGRKSFGTIRGNMNLFYTWGAILGPFVAGAIYDQTQSYALVFTEITISLLISTAMTALLIKPWAKLGTIALTPLHQSHSLGCGRVI
jgi:MFS family permease